MATNGCSGQQIKGERDPGRKIWWEILRIGGWYSD